MFTREEYAGRRQRLLAWMASEKLDVLVIFASKIDAGYVRYYSSYESQLGILDCSFLIVTPGTGREWTLVTNAFWDEPFGLAGLNDVVISGNFAETVFKFIPKGIRSLGIGPYRYFPTPVYRSIAERFNGISVRDITEPLLKLRAVKSEAEIELLRRVAAIADTAGWAFVNASRVGATEREVAAEVEYKLRLAGSDPFIFSTILFSGPQTSKFIAVPGDRKLENGDLVQLDCGPSLEGYHGDYSRVVCAGQPKPQVKSMLEATALMYEECQAALLPGILACEVAERVLRIAEGAGFGPENLYQSANLRSGFVGHGIGLGNPDVPLLDTQDQTPIEEGMVVNIETILRIAGLGGSRLEDAVVVGKNGATRLCSTPIRLWQTKLV
jgi:Xaa-Pro aminopeptidase